LLLLGYFYVIAQALSKKTFSATVPKEAIKLDRGHALSLVHQNSRPSYTPPGIDNTYQLNGLIISYWGLSVPADYHKTLENTQTEILGYMKLGKPTPVVFSKIIAINNIRFLVYEYQRGDDLNLRFQSDFDRNRNSVNGLIQFKKPDEQKAQKALDDLLHTIHFKE